LSCPQGPEDALPPAGTFVQNLRYWIANNKKGIRSYLVKDHWVTDRINCVYQPQNIYDSFQAGGAIMLEEQKSIYTSDNLAFLNIHSSYLNQDRAIPEY
jgi:hypothetical protein